jgi:hypothetical protein
VYGLEVLCYPINEMVFEGPFNELVEKVKRQQLMNVSSGEVISEWLHKID